MNIRYLLCAVALTGSLSAMQKFKSVEAHIIFAFKCATDVISERCHAGFLCRCNDAHAKFSLNIAVLENELSSPYDLTATLKKIAILMAEIDDPRKEELDVLVKRLLSSKSKFYYDPTELDQKFLKDYIFPIENELAAVKKAADAAAAKK